MAGKKSSRITRPTGVALEPPVIDYLDEIARKEHRDRSFIINSIVREHAKKSGRIIPSSERPAETPELRLT